MQQEGWLEQYFLLPVTDPHCSSTGSMSKGYDICGAILFNLVEKWPGKGSDAWGVLGLTLKLPCLCLSKQTTVQYHKQHSAALAYRHKCKTMSSTVT